MIFSAFWQASWPVDPADPGGWRCPWALPIDAGAATTRCILREGHDGDHMGAGRMSEPGRWITWTPGAAGEVQSTFAGFRAW